MNAAQKIKHVELLEAKLAYNTRYKLQRIYDSFYHWQKKFNAATADNDICLLMAANQVGKSRTGCVIDAHHLTGEYPEDWEGHRFDFPPLCWLLGYSGEKTRDLLQKKLFGRFINGELEGGYIPKEKIIDALPMNGTPRAMREVRVQHVNGIATCQFWSYSGTQHSLMGDVVDWFHCDEEPQDQAIFPQLITRTINGNRGRGGKGILTFTPENGKTELVTQFMENDAPGQFMLTATWNDAPHITQEKKDSLLALYPPYQRDMRSKGIPLMGVGLIYQVDEDLVKCEPFQIPSHFKIINGLDFGWDHPLALVQLAIDEENNIIYVTHAFKRKQLAAYEAWQACRSWCENVPIAWPHDGYQTREVNSKAYEKRDMFIEAGFEMLDTHATFEGGGVGVHVGIAQINNLFKTGQFRIFSNLHEVFEELRQYHTRRVGKDLKVEIVKVKDDLLDAIRYAYMMRREAVMLLDLLAEDDDHYYDYDVDRESYSATGY